uniref:Large ribosomal subunit protein uL23c n=1 Tax=Pseudochlorodesmis sp. HV01306c TaxID=2358490 RepID=A0A386AYJ1_9CHLO|nr:ribosomal protein L23 [Pseudochlorodesmis sp. HV01306c]
MYKKKKFNQKIFNFLKKPIITDKATKLIERKQYTFEVDSQLTKKQIKEIFENYYEMQIKSIRTHRVTKKKMSSLIKPNKRVILVFFKKKQIPIFQNLVQKDKTLEKF